MSTLDLLWPSTATDTQVAEGALKVLNLARAALLLEPLEELPLGSFGSRTHPIACALPGSRLWGSRETGVVLEFPTEREARAAFDAWRGHGAGPTLHKAAASEAVDTPTGWLVGIPLVLAEFDYRFENDRYPFLQVSSSAAHPVVAPCKCDRGIGRCRHERTANHSACWSCWRATRKGAQCLH